MAYTTIDDPTKYFDVTIWTGTGGARTISGLNHKPDLIWTKTRSVAYNHMWSDSSRGFNANSELGSNSTAAEGGLSAETYGYKSGHTSDGWTMVDGTDTVDGQEDGNTNQPSVTYVGWTWAANGGTTTSFSASGAQLAGTRQSNTTAGFSIITYTGDGNNNATIPHGLNSAPKFVIIKDRGNATNWYVGHDATFTTGEVFLNLTNALAAAFGPFNKTAPTASNIVLGTDGSVNGSGDTMICYAFAEVQGYSKFGSYIGNGNADGPFVYTGFKPAWLMYRNTSRSENWIIVDNQRNTINPVNGANLQANVSDVEANETRWSFDFLSNGFKIRTNGSNNNANNGSGETIIYMAFAEHPFVSSKGVPVTAR